MRRTPFCVCLLLAATALPAQRNGGAIRPGPWPTAGKVAPGWVVHNTKNYHVQSEAGMEKAKRLGEHMEVMNEVYRRMFRPDKGGTKAQTIKLFKDRAGFRAYGAPRGAAAYYSWMDREMVCYDTGKWSDEPAPVEGAVTGEETAIDRLQRRMRRLDERMTMDLLGCAAHEGWHQYFHWYVGSPVQLPSWINEGMGDYFYTAAPHEKKGRRMPAELGRLNDGRLWVLKTAKEQGRLVPIPELLPMLQGEFYANASICYAEGWALCQFLLHGANGKYAKVIPTYIRIAKDDTKVDTITGKAFQGIDLEALDAEFKAWIDTLPAIEDPMAEEEPEAAPPPPPAEPGTGGGPPAGGSGG